jgi:hypothetical protein
MATRIPPGVTAAGVVLFNLPVQRTAPQVTAHLRRAAVPAEVPGHPPTVQKLSANGEGAPADIQRPGTQGTLFLWAFGEIRARANYALEGRLSAPRASHGT